jgi:hypothetical protein
MAALRRSHPSHSALPGPALPMQAFPQAPKSAIRTGALQQGNVRMSSTTIGLWLCEPEHAGKDLDAVST